MKSDYKKIHLMFRDAMPYMVTLVVILFLANFAKIREIQDDIDNIRQEVEDTKRSVNDICDKSNNTQFDDSDVIRTLKAHHKVISQKIDEAERQINANIIIWGK